MSPLMKALVAYLLFAVQLHLIQRMGKCTPTAALVVLYTGAAPLILTLAFWLKLGGGAEEIVWPRGTVAWFGILAGICFVTGDYLVVDALSKAEKMGQNHLHQVALVAGLYPVFVMAISYAIETRVPNKNHVAAMVFAAIAIYFAALGNQQGKEDGKPQPAESVKEDIEKKELTTGALER